MIALASGLACLNLKVADTAEQQREWARGKCIPEPSKKTFALGAAFAGGRWTRELRLGRGRKPSVTTTPELVVTCAARNTSRKGLLSCARHGPPRRGAKTLEDTMAKMRKEGAPQAGSHGGARSKEMTRKDESEASDRFSDDDPTEEDLDAEAIADAVAAEEGDDWSDDEDFGSD